MFSLIDSFKINTSYQKYILNAVKMWFYLTMTAKQAFLVNKHNCRRPSQCDSKHDQIV